MLNVYLVSKLLLRQVLLKTMEHCLLFFYCNFSSLVIFSYIGIQVVKKLSLMTTESIVRSAWAEDIHLWIHNCLTPYVCFLSKSSQNVSPRRSHPKEARQKQKVELIFRGRSSCDTNDSLWCCNF